VWGTIHTKEGGNLRLFPISFSLPLKEVPEAIFVRNTETSKPGCPGRGPGEGLPEAEPGKLCVYAMQFDHADVFPGEESFRRSTVGEGAQPGASNAGTLLEVECEAEKFCTAAGTWAATAE
jgi:hypothetical protein